MVASMNHTSPSDVTIPLRVVSSENDASDPALAQRTPPHNEGSGKNKQNVSRHRSKLCKKVIIIIAIVLLVSLAGHSIFLHAQMNQREAQMNQREAQMNQREAQMNQREAQMNQREAQMNQREAMSTPKPFQTTSCPQGWTLNAEWCFFFSDAESTWNLSHINCSSYGATLFVMGTSQERTFINENKAPAEYWIGLRREAITEEPWKQPDGSDFDVWFEIKGEGLCATLNDGVVSSTDCDNYRRWICRKPLHAA